MGEIVKRQNYSLAPQNYADAQKFAAIISNSDLAPRDYRGKPANIMVAAEMGSRLGMGWMQSLQTISVINGRAAVWGDAPLAIVKSNDVMEEFEETWDKTTETATCRTLRKGEKFAVVRTFSLKDAKIAGLLDKKGNVWKQYPQRMCQYRARSFCLRDAYPDILLGIRDEYEVKDMPNEIIREQKPSNDDWKEGAPKPETKQEEKEVIEAEVIDTEERALAIIEILKQKKALNATMNNFRTLCETVLGCDLPDEDIHAWFDMMSIEQLETVAQELAMIRDEPEQKQETIPF